MRRGIVLTALFAVLALAPTAQAASVTPTFVAGNPSCAGGIVVQPVTSGTYGPITITVTGSSFSFTTDGTLVTSVIVKGGPNANVYTYPAPGVTSDSDLTAPINPNNGKPYGLSHLCFFVDGEGKPPPDPDPGK